MQGPVIGAPIGKQLLGMKRWFFTPQNNYLKKKIQYKYSTKIVRCGWSVDMWGGSTRESEKQDGNRQMEIQLLYFFMCTHQCENTERFKYCLLLLQVQIMIFRLEKSSIYFFYEEQYLESSFQLINLYRRIHVCEILSLLFTVLVLLTK